jgi:hypothetical protein
MAVRANKRRFVNLLQQLAGTGMLHCGEALLQDDRAMST